MLYASLDTARRIFEWTTKQRPRIWLTIRQHMRVVAAATTAIRVFLMEVTSAQDVDHPGPLNSRLRLQA